MTTKTKPPKAAKRDPLAVKVTVANKLSADLLKTLITKVEATDERLKAAVERKPNKVLASVVHQLQRVAYELGEVYQQLERNNSLVDRLCRKIEAPTLQPMTAAEVDQLIAKRLEERRLRELGGR